MAMTTLVTTLLLSAVLAAPPMHEEGVIHLGTGEAPAGTEIEVRGEELPEVEELRLELRGALATFALDTVRTDSVGAFTARIALPGAADAGSYTVAVIAPDGDVVASAELALLPRVAVEETVSPASGGGAGAPRAEPRQATAAMMDLSATTTPGEWAVVLGFIGVALAGAWVGLRKRGSS